MKLLWLCGVPFELEEKALDGRKVGANAAWSWVMGHLPPPEGVELHIACPAKNISDKLTIEYRGAVFHLFPSMARGAVYTLYRAWIPGFRGVYDEIEPDWVHGWGVEAGYGCAAHALDPVHSVIEIQGILADYYPYIKKSLPFWPALLNERLSLRQGRRFIAESGYSKRSAEKYSKGRFHVVAQPLREEFLTAEVGPRDLKQVVFLGAIDERKGIKDAVQAFAAGAPDNWRLLCVGGGVPEYESEVRSLIKSLGMEERIELLGKLEVTEIIELFRRTPVFLLPTYMDTGPNALKEALAMGLWPVCYDNSGPKEFVGRTRYGSLSPTGSIDALTASLKQTLVGKPWETPGRADQCIRQIRHELNPGTVWKELLKCYSADFWDGL